MAVVVQIDASKVQSQMDIFINAVKASNAIVGDFTTKSLAFNEVGKLVGGTLEQMAASGSKLTASFDVMGNSATLAGAKVTTSAREMAAQLERVELLLGKKAGDKARGLFPLPEDASISRINSYNAQIINLQRAVGAAGLSANQITALFNQAANAPAQFAQRIASLPPQLQAVGQAMLAVAAQAQQAGAAGANAGKSFGISWQGLVRIFEAQIFRRTISALIDGIKSGISAALQYEVQLAQVGNVTQQSGSQLAALGERVRGLSDAFGQPISDVLAASQIALTGQLNDTVAGFSVLNNAMQLSQATGVGLEASTRLITTSLQAFRLEGTEAGRVTNTLYNAAQRTRVPLDEMQAAIGRVSQTAHGLGITFEQTVALFLTISQQGGRPTEAFSLLNQVLGRLLQPTRALTEFLQGLGYTSAQAAIQAEGLPTFLQKLSEAAARNPAALGDLAGSLRTMKSLMAVTGDQIQIFERNLRSLSDSTSTAMQGAANVSRTSAQQILVEFNKIKNVFTQDIGTELVGRTVAISKALGGPQATVAGLITAIEGLIITFAAFKAASVIGPHMAEFSKSMAAGSFAATAFGEKLGFAGAALGTVVNGLLVAIPLVFAIKSAMDGLEAARVSAINSAVAAQRSANATALEGLNQLGSRQRELASQLVQEAYRDRTTATSQALQAAQQEAEAAKLAHQASQDSFRVANQSILDGLRQRLSEIRRQKDEAKAGQEESKKSAESFAQGVQAQGFRGTLALNDDPRRAIELINRRREQIQAESEAIFNNPNATREQIARARQLFDEEQNLNGELRKHEVELQRIRASQTNNYTIEIRNGQRVRVLRLDISEALERDAEIIARRNRLEERHAAILKEKEAEAKNAEAAQIVRLRTLESALRRQEQISPFGNDGKIKPVFTQQDERRPGSGRADFERQFREQSEALIARTAESLGPDANRRGTEAFKIVQDLRDTEAQRLRTLLAEYDAATRTSRVQAQQVEESRQMTAELARYNQLLQDQIRIRQSIADASQTGSDIALKARSNLAGDLVPVQAPFGLTDDARQRRADVTRDYNAFRDSLDGVIRAQERLRQNQSAENIQAYRDAVQQATAAQRAFITTADRVGETSTRGAGISADRVNLIRRLGTDARNGLPELERIQYIVGEIQRTELTPVNSSISEMITRLGGTTLAAQAMTSELQSTLSNAGSLNEVFATTRTRIQELNAELAETNRLVRSVPPIGGGGPPAPGRWMGGPVGYRAGGGLTSSHPGGPRGTDTLPYWLSPGEFIVNSHSTGKFYSQLLAINAGHQPKYAAGGGPVTVGDINVHVNGGQQSEKTIRDIGNGINREIRRGTIRWRV